MLENVISINVLIFEEIKQMKNPFTGDTFGLLQNEQGTFTPKYTNEYCTFGLVQNEQDTFVIL